MSRLLISLAAAGFLVLTLSACTETRRSNPERTATEQLLLSTAMDRAAGQLDISLPAGTRIYIDASRFKGYDEDYAIGVMRDRFLVAGLNIALTRELADVIVEIRSGALSTSGNRTLVGIPSFSIPIPLTGDLTVPELSLVAKERRRGIAKVAFTAYWRQDGSLANRNEPVVGVSGYDNWEVLGLNWLTGDDFLEDADIPPEKKAGADDAAPE